jgi:protein KRI1
LEELKHLKELKKEMLRSKLRMIQDVGGKGSIEIPEKELQSEFDPLKYDQLVEKAFGDQYYQEKEEKLESNPQIDQMLLNDKDFPDVNIEENPEGKEKEKDNEKAESENEEELWWFCDGNFIIKML